MNHKPFHTKFYLSVIVLIVAASTVVFTAIETRATQRFNLEELAQIKEGIPQVDTRLTGPSRLEELARIKDEVFPVVARLTGPSRLEELARIKER